MKQSYTKLSVSSPSKLFLAIKFAVQKEATTNKIHKKTMCIVLQSKIRSLEDDNFFLLNEYSFIYKLK